METRQWQGLTDHILYSVIFRQSLDEDAVESTARAILSRRVLGAGPEAYTAAIDSALTSTDPVTQNIETPHSEREFRDFLGRLRHRLEEMRPWPEPSYVQLPIENWALFATARPVARVGQSVVDLQDRLAMGFDKLPGDPDRSGLILRLQSGDTVALVGSYGMGRPVTLLQRDPGPPGPVITALLISTPIAEDMVVPLRESLWSRWTRRWSRRAEPRPPGRTPPQADRVTGSGDTRDGMTVTYEQAREIVRQATEPDWSIGTYCLDDRGITENDERYVFQVGAREHLIDRNISFALVGAVATVVKSSGALEWLPSVIVATDPSFHSRPNPAPTLRV